MAAIVVERCSTLRRKVKIAPRKNQPKISIWNQKTKKFCLVQMFSYCMNLKSERKIDFPRLDTLLKSGVSKFGHFQVKNRVIKLKKKIFLLKIEVHAIDKCCTSMQKNFQAIRQSSFSAFLRRAQKKCILRKTFFKFSKQILKHFHYLPFICESRLIIRILTFENYLIHTYTVNFNAK